MTILILLCQQDKINADTLQFATTIKTIICRIGVTPFHADNRTVCASILREVFVTKKNEYDCSKCPGWCCSYERIRVTPDDIDRLADHFDSSPKEIKDNCLEKHGKDLYLRHREDPIYKSICVFFHRIERRCMVYEARPEVCHHYPWGKRCGYYDFIKFEREQMGDNEFIPLPYPKPDPE